MRKILSVSQLKSYGAYGGSKRDPRPVAVSVKLAIVVPQANTNVRQS